MCYKAISMSCLSSGSQALRTCHFGFFIFRFFKYGNATSVEFDRLWTWEFAFLDVVLRNTDNIIGTSLKGNTYQDGLDSDFSIEFWNDFRWISMEKVLRIVWASFNEKRIN
ncbi:hypothetical protein RCL_jg3988.t2 [Rhizophagus clarus]|uniref:Uncharacterized protein n=1 Tax=Rhizophagus clarus TaxID=94130 RepID=A0A8H3KSU7_9GLOM|nr:hypothetical protein RCL_jg3988.t2 [Rhizophagus clarus]